MRTTFLILLLSCLTSLAQGFSQSIAFKAAANKFVASPCATVQNSAQAALTSTNQLSNPFYWTYFFASNSTYTACAVAINATYTAATHNTNQFRIALSGNPPTPGMSTNLLNYTDWMNCSSVPAIGAWVTNTLLVPKELTQNTVYSAVIQMRRAGALPSNSDFITWRIQAAQNGTSRVRTSADGDANTAVNSDTAQFIIFSQ